MLAVCRYFSYIINNDSSEQPFESGLISWGLNEAIQDNTYIHYECEHYSIVIERKIEKEHFRDIEDGIDEEVDLPLFTSVLTPRSNEFTNLLNEFDKIKPKSIGGFNLENVDWRIPTSFFQNEVAEVMDNPFYLATERGLQSIFSIGRSSIQNISDSLFNVFAQLDSIARLFGMDTDIEPLDIIYKNVQGKGFIRKKDEDDFFSLFNAASGYQSTIPIVLLIRYYSEMRKKSKTFIIEEPELNLFPRTQQKLVQFLVDRTINYANSMFLTTHSPYILTSLNNLMYAYKIGQDYPSETESIIKKKYWQNPEDVSAYMLYPDGTATNIIDTEIGQIMTEKIDEVSRELNDDFDKMLDLKYLKRS